MEKKSKLILGLMVVLLGVSLAVWLGRKSSPVSTPSAKIAGGQPMVVPTTPKPVPPTSGTATSQKKHFARMPILERNAILEEIKKMDFPSILQAMLDAGRIEGDIGKQLAIQAALTSAMRERTPPPEFFEQMRKFLTDNSNSDSERQLVLSALGATATVETTDFLIQLATAAPDKTTRQLAGGFLALAGMQQGAGVSVAPAIEKLWRESDDQNLIMSVSHSMAKIGAPSSIELLLSAALGPDGQDNLRKGAALGALEEVYQPRAVPPLSEVLTQSKPGTPASQLTGHILVNIGDVTAGKALIGWLQNADERAVPLAQEWVVSTHSTALLNTWDTALDANVPFRNEQNREAIRTALAQYHQNHQ